VKSTYSTVSEPFWPGQPTTLGKSNLILGFYVRVLRVEKVDSVILSEFRVLALRKLVYVI